MRSTLWLCGYQIRLLIFMSFTGERDNLMRLYGSSMSCTWPTYNDAEWMLNPKLFNETLNILSFQTQIECFATRKNTHLSEYFSRIPDLEAKSIDALTVNSCRYLFHIFPLFSCYHAKDSSGASRSSNCSTLLANPTLIRSNFEVSSTRNSNLQTLVQQI